MKRSPLIALILAALSLCAAWTQTTRGAEPPNVVLIVADDLGWADVSFHGEEIQTPNIDRIAREGVELARFYVCPICSPTRAGIMTGRYPIRMGLMRAVLPPWRDGGLDIDEPTLPEALAKVGYEHRGCFGKWHLGHSSRKYHPLNQGFTEFVGHYNGAIDYFTHEREGELDWHHGFESNHDDGYSTDLIAEAAVKFIQAHAGGDAPFFCYVPFNAPHSPLQAKEEKLALYEHLITEKEKAADPTKGNKGKKRKREGTQGRGQGERQTLAAMISSLDDSVGSILQALEDQGISQNTLVWFFSDNGGTGTGDNRPLKGAKSTAWEGGIRVTAALRWPGQVKPGGKIESQMGYIDVLPTLWALAGGKLEDLGFTPDGVDVSPFFKGETADPPARKWLSYYGQKGEQEEQVAVHEGPWKLVVTGPKVTDDSPGAEERREVYLFDILEDPNETTNLAAGHPKVVARLRQAVKEFRALQPADAVPPYDEGKGGDFVPPKEWQVGE